MIPSGQQARNVCWRESEIYQYNSSVPSSSLNWTTCVVMCSKRKSMGKTGRDTLPDISTTRFCRCISCSSYYWELATCIVDEHFEIYKGATKSKEERGGAEYKTCHGSYSKSQQQWHLSFGLTLQTSSPSPLFSCSKGTWPLVNSLMQKTFHTQPALAFKVSQAHNE
jgi:hypothetical protein